MFSTSSSMSERGYPAGMSDVTSNVGSGAAPDTTLRATQPGDLAAALLRAARDGPALASCTVLSATDGSAAVGAKMLAPQEGPALGSIGGGPLEAAVLVRAREAIPQHLVATIAFTPDGAIVEGRRAIEAAEQIVEVLIEVVEPAATLLVVGGGHVGRAVGEVGAMLGMEVVLLDDREEYANPERFAYPCRVICGDFDEELQRFPITANTYIVLVSRGHIVDELSLRQVVTRGPGYVGMIGSKRRTRTVIQHLAEDGINRESLDRVFTPIGLDIGAETPEEIAVAVLGEIILVRRGGGALPMSEHGRQLAGRRRASLHAAS